MFFSFLFCASLIAEPGSLIRVVLQWDFSGSGVNRMNSREESGKTSGSTLEIT